uniref:NFX1-type zinc finger-containing protein 1 isoform X1 n=2 Tax=Ciona intestinalis TaxID=7719 RepID=UPI000521B647|nr:NFX1-type zinc finger-containing protein 1 isoform X1 [Ciona intestinalis]|eukprot:XP_009860073.1 NFX1-type zinc finger-containing protein 1 isoform X1 [Ciona intestinalis]
MYRSERNMRGRGGRYNRGYGNPGQFVNDRPPGGRGQARGRGGGEDGGAARNSNFGENSIIHPVGFKKLKELVDDDDILPRDLVIKLSSNRSGFYQRLKLTMDGGMTQMVLQVCGKLCKADGPRTAQLEILKMLRSTFAEKLPGFIAGLILEPSGRQRQAPNHVINCLLLMKAWQEYLLNSTMKEVSMLLLLLKPVTAQLGINNNEKINELITEIETRNAEAQRAQEEKKVNRHEQRRVELNEMHQCAPPNNFREISVFPTKEDITTREDPFVRTNLVNRAYTGPDHYLDVQFRLLREDFVRPLREGIENFVTLCTSGSKRDRSKRLDNVKAYQDVRIDYPVPSNRGIHYYIHFSTESLQRIRWENTKRFLFGNLICLSDDHFKEHFMFATVADRDPKKLAVGYLMVEFVQKEEEVVEDETSSEEEYDVDDYLDDDVDEILARRMARRLRVTRRSSPIDMKKTYTMVETDAFFESYRHILAGLQEINDVPLSRYLVECRVDMQPPKYLNQATSMYDLSSIQTEDSRLGKVNVLDLENWPTCEDLNMDDSQRNAMQVALTNELALIQGPPGTGKTYVGLKVMRVLLANMKPSFERRNRLLEIPDPRHQVGALVERKHPILVVCYTNHALDQFLEGIASFHPSGIIRVGGRCKNKELEKYTLKWLRRNRRATTNKIHRTAVWHARCEMESLRNTMKRDGERLEGSTNCIINLKQLKEVIPDHLYAQFFQIENNEKFTSKNEDAALLTWLDLQLNQNEGGSDSFILRESTGVVERHFTSMGFSLPLIRLAINNVGLDSYHVEQWLLMHISHVVRSKVTVQRDVVYSHLQSLHLPPHLIHLTQLGYELLEVQCGLFCTGTDHPHVVLEWLKQHSPNGIGMVDDNDDNLMPEEAQLIQEQRMVDEGDERNEQKQRELKRDRQIQKEIAAATFMDISGNTEDDEAGWSITPEEKRRRKQRIKREIGKTDAMSTNEAIRVKDIFALSIQDKWKLYRRWVEDWKDGLRSSVERHTGLYNNLARKLNELREEEDFALLEDADVIGMTTSGAARFRSLVQRIPTKVVIVEEAAEVLEAHIVTSMPRTTEHLILIGDHQQLKPSPTVYQLAKDYNLDVSLFERMINNNIPCAKLAIQHRMKPSIANLIRPEIYKNLLDHESVLKYEEISGVSKSVFFISHEQKEDTVLDGRTKVNNYEARYMVALCKHLMLQDYKPSQITILTTYTGQLFAFKRIMEQTLYRGVRVTAVDNYQGEENDIILLSLVRSNDEGRIGFLSVRNRVCVALSRAKKGLYCIGNLELLKEKSDLWQTIVAKLQHENMTGTALTLQCKNHPETTVKVESPEDFEKFPEGGCGKVCEVRLPCGHVCPRSCHPDDQDHTKFKCRKPCPKSCSKGHRCKKKCSDDCGPCTERMEKMVPSCCHIEKMYCSKDPSEHICLKPCSKTLACGHKCTSVCGRPCKAELCTEKIKVDLSCGHESKILCRDSANPDKDKCNEPCDEMLKCGHVCKGTCSSCMQGRLHKRCGKKCGRVLFCGHACTENCAVNCPPCQVACSTQCEHSKCKKKCMELCVLCTEPCEWRCSHYKCNKLCSEPCDRPPCNEPCDQTLKCGHPCIGLCGEPCPKLCRICDKAEVTEIFFGDEEEDDARFVELPECGHVFTYDGLDKWMNMDDENDEDVDIQLKKCPKCNTFIRSATRYGQVINNQLRAINMVKEKSHGTNAEIRIATRQLDRKLNERESFQCCFTEDVILLRQQLGKNPKSLAALTVIETQFNGLCSLSTVMTKVKKLKRTADPHTSEIIHLLQSLQKDILHTRAWLMEDRSRYCEQEIDDFERELKRIYKAFTFTIIQDNFDKNKRYLENKHTVRPLVKQGVQLLFENFAPYEGSKKEKVKTALKQIKQLEPCLLENGKLTKVERDMIVKAMNLSKGHWYKCKNGHIYCIDQCGGATQRSVCPECKEVIGGEGHRLYQDNSVATEMDGATRPAYDPQNLYIPPEVFF